MPLTLTIENERSLPDGGPLSATATPDKPLEIGRDQYMDWVLPDPNRVISGRHCEIRYRDGGYWLLDHSRNGTFLYGSEFRVENPHALRHGDRIEIGHYIVQVAIQPDAQRAAPPGAPAAAAPAGDLWDVGADAAPPMPKNQFKAAPPRAEPFADAVAWGDDAWARPVSAEPAVVPAPARPAAPTPARPRVEPPPVDPPTTSDFGGDERPVAPPPPPSDFVPVERPAPPTAASDSAAIIARFAKGLGLSPAAIAESDAGALAETLGEILRESAEHLRQLQAARAQSKGVMRSARHTVIEATENNPLKFTPTAEDALRIMFGEPSRSYLDARRAFDASFADAKKHQVLIFSAMQSALNALVADLDPKAIEEANPAGGGLLGSRKAKLWDAYVAAWAAKAGKADKGLLETFLRLFAEAYDRAG